MNQGRKSKHAKYFDRIKEIKERLNRLPSDVLQKRLTYPALYKEAAIAIRQVLEERLKEGTSSK